MAKQVRHSDLYEDAILQKSVALMKKIGDAMLTEHKKTIAEIKKGWAEIGSGVSGKGVRANQQYAETLKKIQSEQYRLNEVQKQRISIEKQLVRQQALSNKENRKAQAEVRKLKNANREASKEIDKQNGVLKKQGGLFTSLINGAKGYIAAWVGIQTVVRLIKSVVSTTKELDSIAFTLRAVIDDQNELATTQGFLTRIARDYGVEIVKLSRNYARFRAAVKQTNLTLTQTRDIFDTVVKAGAVLGLSSERIELALLAIEQMASKGTVSMEELRRQLGDNIPGATQIMADALNVSTKELFKMIKANEVLAEDALPKFAEELEKVYGLESVDKVDTLAASMSRLTTEWQLFVGSLQASPLIAAAFEGMAAGISKVSKFFSSTSQYNALQATLTDVTKDSEKLFNTMVEGLNKEKRTAADVNAELEKNLKLYELRVKALDETKVLLEDFEGSIGGFQSLMNLVPLIADEGSRAIKELKSLLSEEDFKNLMELQFRLERLDIDYGDESLGKVIKELNTYRGLITLTQDELGVMGKAVIEEAGQLSSLQNELNSLQENRKYLTEDELNDKKFILIYDARILAIQHKLNDINDKKAMGQRSLLAASARLLEIEQEIANIQFSNIFEAFQPYVLAALNEEAELTKDLILELQEIFAGDEPTGQIAIWEREIKQLNKDLKNVMTRAESQKIVDEIEVLKGNIENFTRSTNDMWETFSDKFTKAMEKATSEYSDFIKNTEKANKDIGKSLKGLFKNLGADEREHLKNIGSLYTDLGKRKEEFYQADLDLLREELRRGNLSEAEFAFDSFRVWIKHHDELINEVANTADAISDMFGTITEGQITLAEQEFDIHETRLNDLESQIDTEYALMLDGQNNRYDLIVSEKQREEALRQDSLEKLKRLRKQEAAIELAQQTGAMITASANVFKGTANDPVTVAIAIGTIASMIAAFAGFRSQIKAIESDDPGFAEGTEFVHGPGTKKSDSVKAKLSVGERVVPAEINEKLGGVPNDSLPDLMNVYKLNMPNILGVSGDDYYSKALLKAVNGQKDSTDKLNRYLKYEDVKMLPIGNNKVLIKVGTKTMEATINK